MRTLRGFRVGLALVTVLTLILSSWPSTAVKGAGQVDFVAHPVLEVTQGVQTMHVPASDKFVPLVAGKRTYVIFYATGSLALTNAILSVERNGKTTLLQPLNTNGAALIMPIAPWRQRGGAGRFVWELPAAYRSGTIKLRATLNHLKTKPADEANFGNNSSSQTTITFQPVDTVTLDVWDVRYKRLTGDRVYQLADLAPTDHRALFVDWMRRAYPLSGVKWWKRAIYMGRWANIDGKLNGYCVATNWALYHNGSFPADTYGYGMVADTGGYMRGCADPFHDVTASGPTGNTGGDGSYGDDYGGHELGHLFGRDHAAFCGAGIPKSSYPYPDGSISPIDKDQVGYPNAVVGYDIHTRATFNYTWSDIMTYCDFRWPSDYSYKHFLGRLRATQSSSIQVSPTDEAVDRLMVRGVIDANTGHVAIRPSFVLPASQESPRHRPGPYTFVMRDHGGAELARYPFTPSEETALDQGPSHQSDSGESPFEPEAPMFFHELVPYHRGTARIDVVAPDDKVLGSVTAGLTPPTVRLLTANSPSRVLPDQQELVVRWTGADTDGDPVHYLLQYSNDEGRSWLQYTDAITETEVRLPRENLLAGPKVLLRVLATDGIHTSADTNDAPISVLNHPPTVKILPPIGEALPAPVAGGSSLMSQTTYAVGQTVTLQAEGYDIDVGSLDGELTWSSDKAGELQRGHTLSAADLGVGRHTITVTADDGHGGTATDSIAMTIVPDVTDLPPAPDRLMVDADMVVLDNTGTPTQTLVIHNQNPNTVLPWTATVDQPWLQLSAASGTTPGLLTLGIKPGARLAAGAYTGAVSFTSPAVPAQRESVVVKLNVAGSKVYLPLVAP